jgi:hypothetical protein
MVNGQQEDIYKKRDRALGTLSQALALTLQMAMA